MAALNIPAQDWVNFGRAWAVDSVAKLQNVDQGVFNTDIFHVTNFTPSGTLRMRLGSNRNGNGADILEFVTVSGGSSANASISRGSGTNGVFELIQVGTGTLQFVTPSGKVSAVIGGNEMWKTDSVNTIIFNNMLHQGSQIAFFNGGSTSKQTVTGSRGGNAALASLLTALANYSLITNSTSA